MNVCYDDGIHPGANPFKAEFTFWAGKCRLIEFSYGHTRVSKPLPGILVVDHARKPQDALGVCLNTIDQKKQK
jgi:hypothetical protein